MGGWKPVKMQLVSQLFSLWNRKALVKWCNWVQDCIQGLVSGEHLTFFIENVLSLLYVHLKDDAVSEVFDNLLPKINQ